MPVIVNAYKSDTSLGDTINSLGQHLFGKEVAQGDLLRQKTHGLRRNNEAIQELQRQASTPGGVDYASPMARAAAYGLDSPKEAFEAQRGIAANQFGAMDPRATNAAVGAGGNYASTGQGFTTSEANTMARAKYSADTAAGSAERMAANHPYSAIDPDTKMPITVSQRDAIRRGLAPVLTSGQVEGALRQKGFESGYAGQNPQQQKASGVFVPHGETEAGFNTAQDNAMERNRVTADKAANSARLTADMTPMNVYHPTTGQPTVMARSEAIAIGARPVLGQGEEKGVLTNQNFTNLPALSTGQRQVIGANPPQEHVLNWQLSNPDGTTSEGISHDGGLTDARTNARIPSNARVWGPTSAGGANVIGAPTNTVNTHLQEKHANNRELVGMTQQAEQLIDQNPFAVGATGNSQQYAQRAQIAAAQMAAFLGKGKDWQSAAANTRNELSQKYGGAAMQLFPELFNPAMTQLDALYGMMTYKTAQALFGQEGRGLNIEDVKRTQEILGHPGNWTTNPAEMKARLGMVRNAAQANVTNAENVLRQKNTLQPPVGGAPGQPNAGGAVIWTRGPDGIARPSSGGP